MKKFSKVLALFMCATMLFGAMTGCAAAEKAPTAESLLKGYQEKVQSAEGMKADVDMDLQMKVSVFGMEESIKMGGTMNVESSGENAYAKADFTMESSEGTETAQTEIYVMKEGDKFVEYQCTDGEWTKTSVDGAGQIDGLIKNKYVGDPAKFTMETTDTEYVLKGTVSIKEAMESMPEGMFDEMMASMGSEMTEDMLANISDVPVEYHFDKKTRDLKSMSMDMTAAMQELFAVAMQDAMAELGDMEGMEGMEDFDMSTLFNFEVGALKLNVKNIVYEAVTITLPEEAKNAKEVSADDMSVLNIGE